MSVSYVLPERKGCLTGIKCITVWIHATVHLHNSKRMLCSHKNRWWLHNISWKSWFLSLFLCALRGLNHCECGEKDVKPCLMRQEQINLLKINGSVSCQQVALVHFQHYFLNLTLKTDFTLHKSSVYPQIRSSRCVLSSCSQTLKMFKC